MSQTKREQAISHIRYLRRELPKKYPIKSVINDIEYLRHGLLAQILNV